MLLINLLILFFILLICYQVFLAKKSFREGLSSSSSSDASGNSYQPYNTSDPNNVLILAQQNAGNISFLQQQINSLMNLKTEVQDLSGNVANLQTQVNGIVAAQQQYSSSLNNAGAPNVTGTGATDANGNPVPPPSNSSS
jgi:TolA-binding protein